MYTQIRSFPIGVSLATLLVFAAPPSAQAQGAKDACWIRGNPSEVRTRPSPLDSASVTLDAGTIKICYGRPSRRGRPVLGQLLPFGAPWRLGANEATAIYVSFPARIASTTVEPGWYSVYAIPEEKQWRVVVNGTNQRWGVPIDDAVRQKDLGSAVIPVDRLSSPVETLTMTLTRRSNSSATMDVEWENAHVRIPIEQR